MKGYGLLFASLLQPDRTGNAAMIRSPARLALTDLPLGRPARISAIEGDSRFVRRCYSLGLHVGREIVVTKLRGGGLVVAAGPARVALGRDTAERIEVETVPEVPGEAD